MTRTAPLLTLLAVAVLGGGLLATNYVTAAVPAAGPVAAPAAVSAPVADRQTGTVPAPGVVGTVPDSEEWGFTADGTSVEDAVAGGRDDVADVADRAGMAY